MTVMGVPNETVSFFEFRRHEELFVTEIEDYHKIDFL